MLFVVFALGIYWTFVAYVFMLFLPTEKKMIEFKGKFCSPQVIYCDNILHVLMEVCNYPKMLLDSKHTHGKANVIGNSAKCCYDKFYLGRDWLYVYYLYLKLKFGFESIASGFHGLVHLLLQFNIEMTMQSLMIIWSILINHLIFVFSCKGTIRSSNLTPAVIHLLNTVHRKPFTAWKDVKIAMQSIVLIEIAM